jgi:hypothetical protein
LIALFTVDIYSKVIKSEDAEDLPAWSSQEPDVPTDSDVCDDGQKLEVSVDTTYVNLE